MPDQTDDNPTCGKGLAEHSAVPGKLAELLAALADNLDAHVPAIDATDANGRNERDAYVGLTSDFRRIADRLRATAERMAGYPDLPMARHHTERLMDPRIVRSFEAYVARERELLDLLAAAAERDRQMLDGMRAAHAASRSAPGEAGTDHRRS